MTRMLKDSDRKLQNADLTAARQLLRCLHNTQRLKGNRLVSHFFSGAGDSSSRSEIADRVRALILEVINAFQSDPSAGVRTVHPVRQYTILTRYDIGGESRQAVGRDLGIGASKFYYERRAALAKLAEGLKRRSSSAALQQTSTDDFDIHQRSAFALKELGRCDLAIALLRSLVNQAPDDAHRASALCALVETFCDTGKPQEAINALDAAREVAGKACLAGDDGTYLRASIDHAAIHVAWATGRSADALTIADRAVPALRSIVPGGQAPRLLLATVLKLVGDIRSNTGMLTAALADFAEALAILDTCDERPSGLRAVILSNIAFAQAIMPGGMPLARKTNKAALELATSQGLLRNVAGAHVNELQFDYWRGSIDSALLHGKVASAITNAICEPVERSRVATLHARIEALTGNAHVGLQRVRKAREILPKDSYLWILSHVVESQILLRLQRPDEALAAGKIGARGAEQVGSERGRGLSALARAEAYEAKALPKKAIDALNISIPALEKSGGLFPLAQALSCSARLTGNYHHRADASDLLESFR